MVLLVGEVPVLRLEPLQLVGELLPGAVATGTPFLEEAGSQADCLHLGLEPAEGLGCGGAVVHVMLLVDDSLIISLERAPCTSSYD